MHYHETPPPDDLAGIVRCLWELRGSGPGAAEPALPDGSPELIFSLADPFEQVDGVGRATRQPMAFLVGQITRPMAVRPTGVADLVAVRFEAHGAALVHQPMHALTDRWIDLGLLSVPALSRLDAELRSGSDRRDHPGLVWCAVRGLLDGRRAPDARVAAAVHVIRTRHGAIALDDLAVQLDCSVRTLQRLFLRDVGIGPKLLARIVRFQRVFGSWRADPASLARVAFECGYTDQSHLTRDFGDFAGRPPAGFLAALPAFTELLLHGGGRQPG